MEKNPEKEIFVDPQWPIIFDGHGYDAALIGGLPSVDNTGRKINVLIIKPGPRTRKRYNLRAENELDVNGNMRLTVLEDDLVVLNHLDKANERYIYLKSFNHEPTSLSNREEYFKTRLEFKDKRILLLEAQNIRLAEQLELAKTNPMKFMKQGFELFESAGKTFSEFGKKEEKVQ